MFMHQHPNRRAQAMSLGLLTAALFVATAGAGEPAAPFVLVAYANVAGGTNLASGDYASAAHTLQHAPRSVADQVSALDTNRCVASLARGQLPAARSACNAAVADAQRDSASMPAWGSRRLYEGYEAQAYSNRAVLNWLSADEPAAAADLARAQSLAPAASFVTQNVAVLRAHENAPALSAQRAQPGR
jgi:Flp pilus assembly protein TadD